MSGSSLSFIDDTSSLEFGMDDATLAQQQVCFLLHVNLLVFNLIFPIEVCSLSSNPPKIHFLLFNNYNLFHISAIAI